MMCRCGNVAAILELDEHLNKSFKVRDSLKHPQLACMHPARRRAFAVIMAAQQSGNAIFWGAQH